MNRENAKQLLSILKMAYPRYFTDITQQEATETIDLYVEMFEEYDFQIVGHALKNYIKVNQYPPTIAGLQEQIDLLIGGDTAEEQWNILVKAVKKSGYRSREEFEKLPPQIQKWVGSPNTLWELGMIGLETFNTVVKGQFLKTIGQIEKRDKAQDGLPEEIRQRLKQALQLDEGGEENA